MEMPLIEVFGIIPGFLALQGLAILVLLKGIALEPARVAYATQARSLRASSRVH